MPVLSIRLTPTAAGRARYYGGASQFLDIPECKWMVGASSRKSSSSGLVAFVIWPVAVADSGGLCGEALRRYLVFDANLPTHEASLCTKSSRLPVGNNSRRKSSEARGLQVFDGTAPRPFSAAWARPISIRALPSRGSADNIGNWSITSSGRSGNMQPESRYPL